MRVLFVLGCVAMHGPGARGRPADSADVLRAEGRLVEAGDAFSRSADQESPWQAAECWLRACSPDDALASFRRCLEARPKSETARAWIAYLSGEPVPFPDLPSTAIECAREAHLAGLYCRVTGAREKERMWLRVAAQLGPDDVLIRADRARVEDEDAWPASEQLQRDGKLHAEVVLYGLEAAVRRRQTASEWSSDPAAWVEGDPRFASLRRLWKGLDPIVAVPASASHLYADLRAEVWAQYRLDRSEQARAAGIPRDEFTTQAVRAWLEVRHAEGDAMLRTLRGSPQAMDVRVARALSYFTLSDCGHAAPMRHLARKGLADCLAVAACDPNRIPVDVLSWLAYTFGEMRPELSFEELAAWLERSLHSYAAVASTRFEAARQMRLEGRSARALASLEQLAEEYGDVGGQASYTLDELRRLEHWSRLESASAALFVGGVNSGGEGADLSALVKPEARLILIVLADPACSACQVAVPKVQQWYEQLADGAVQLLVLGYGAPLGDTTELRDRVASRLRSRGWPTYCVVDGAGRILGIREGAMHGLASVIRGVTAQWKPRSE